MGTRASDMVFVHTYTVTAEDVRMAKASIGSFAMRLGWGDPAAYNSAKVLIHDHGDGAPGIWAKAHVILDAGTGGTLEIGRGDNLRWRVRVID